MQVTTRIRIVQLVHVDYVSLAFIYSENLREGRRIVPRLVQEFESGTNRFDAPGEALFAAELDGLIVGVCGLNRDPYSGDPHAGRIRRLYVAPQYRLKGIGRLLVHSVAEFAKAEFGTLVLRAPKDAWAFYRALRFDLTKNTPGATHVRRINDEVGHLTSHNR